jgi:hypothetical protein
MAIMSYQVQAWTRTPDKDEESEGMAGFFFTH